MTSYSSKYRSSHNYEVAGYYLPYNSPVLQHERAQRRERLHEDMAISKEVTNRILARAEQEFEEPIVRRSLHGELIVNKHNQRSIRRSIQGRSSEKKSFHRSYGGDSIEPNPQRMYESERKHTSELKRSRQFHRTTY